jgi:hypothetical protein
VNGQRNADLKVSKIELQCGEDCDNDQISSAKRLDSPCQDIREALRAFPALDSHLVDHEGQAENQT